MSGYYNPSANETLGLEWLVTDTPSTFVLDSAAKAYAHYLPGASLKRSQSLAVYAEVVSGVGVFGCECYSAPYTVRAPQSYTTCYAGTDTGAEFTSTTNGSNAWLDAGGGVASYADVSPGVDDTTYLKNVNQVEGPVPARMMFRGAGAQTVLAGRRILDVEMFVRVKSTLATSPTFRGCFNISGTDYQGQAVVVPTNQGYQELSLGRWFVNPSTNKPWTVPGLNGIVTTGATDEFGVLATWDARYTTSYADTIRVSKVWLVVRWQPEDRVGYASGEVSATGWQTWTSASVPNLISKQDSNLDTDTAATGTWTAGSNTTLSNDTLDPGGSWSRSLKMLSGAAGEFSATSGYYPCIEGKTYSVRCFANVTSGRTTVLSILFYDTNGTLLQTSASSGDVGTGSWAAIGMSAVVTAPTNATQMKLKIATTATAGSQTCYATGIFVGLGQSAITFVRTTSPGGAAATKVDGSAETSSIAHPVDELRVFRRLSGTGVMAIPTFGPGVSDVGMPLGHYSYRPTLQDPAGALLALNAVGTDCSAVIATSLSGWDSANGPIASLSQPYARRITGLVNVGNTIESELTLPVKTYLAVRLVVAGEINQPASALTLKIKKRSDNSQLGGNAVINPTDLEAIIPPGGSVASRTTPQVFLAAIPSATAAAATQYYVEATSSAAAGSGWVLYALDSMGYTADSVSVDTITFGANTDAWTNPGDGGELARRNGMICLQTQPSAPTGLAVAQHASGIQVSWTATAVGATFAATEVWRYTTDDGWQQVADLATEATASWVDKEARRGVNTQYRLRTRRTDGALSDYTAASAGITRPTAGAELLLVSNESSVEVAAQRTGDQTYEPPQQVVIREFYGRDGAVAFLPLEDPLDAFSVEVSLYWSGISTAASGIGPPATEGRAAFSDLETLVRSSISYVCVLDNEGSRWFANVKINGLKRSHRSGNYTATLDVRELTRTPSTPTE